MGGDLGQQCVVTFINVNGKEWISSGELNGRKDRALLGLAVAVGVLAMMWEREVVLRAYYETLS